MTLQEFFADLPAAGMGLSGGVDSALLLAAACQSGADVRPYFVKTAFQPAFELEDAQKVADLCGVPLTVIELDVLALERVAENPADRCYHCKNAIFSALAQRAAADGRTVLLDGTNASDDASDRPGMRALREMGVRSPLRECGLDKTAVRRLAKQLGLPVWDKPAYACLATRVPTGQRLEAQQLRRIEQAEGALFGMGFSDFRVRVLGNTARLQLPACQLPQAFDRRQEITAALGALFDGVLLDLRAR